MTFVEEKKNLFEVNNYVKKPYVLAHCVSADLVMGGGIAKQFQDKYNLKLITRQKYASEKLVANYSGGRIAPVENIPMGLHKVTVYNLITKRFVFNKPTYGSLHQALKDLRDDMVEHNYSRLAMPRIGCGLDMLNWDKVKEMIQEVFKDTNISIKICYINE